MRLIKGHYTNCHCIHSYHGGGCLNCDLVLVDVELPCLGLWPHALAVEHIVEQLARHLVVIIMMVMTMMIVITTML